MTLVPGGALPGKWRAGMAWCAAPRDNAGSRCFLRRTFDLAAVPPVFRIFVSADSRYRLFVNGRLAGRGPLKGTLRHYFVEEYDIAGLLQPGRNVLAADVLWFGVNMPLSEEHSGFSGFLLQGPEDAGVDTPGAWKAWADTSFSWDRTPYTSNAHLFLAGMERVDGSRVPSGWEQPAFDDAAWEPAVLAVPLNGPGGDPDADLVWNFAPRDLPALVEEPRRFSRVLHDMAPVANPFEGESGGWSLAAGEGGEIVLDAGEMTTGYPTFVFEGGSGRTVEIVYGECVLHRTDKPDDGSPYLWGGGGRLCKQVRDDVSGGIIHGLQDTVILPEGDTPFTYEPFHWRTFWYVKVKASPGPGEFRLRNADYRFTSFPLIQKATFGTGEQDVARMWDVSWRTLQLCSHETYEDCPGYEQLNYLFDARNEALTTLYLTGDPTLPQHTIRQFRDTLRPDGMLSSRTPSQLRQTIPMFALWWVQMVLDYWDWMGERDGEFVRSCLIAVDAVLAYFRERLRPDGFVGELPYWNPIGGEDAPGTDLDPAIKAGGSTYVTALYLMALRAGARLHHEAGHPEDANRWARTRDRLNAAIASAWSEARGVFVERTSEPDAPVSQHTQAMVILSRAASEAQMTRAVASIIAGVPVAKMTRQQGLPFAHAMLTAGRYDVAARQFMAEYRSQLALHLSTWLEGGENGRSDCHAWSAWLPVELLGSVLGIRPGSPGFTDILFAPHPVFGDARGTVPTPVGDVSVAYSTKNATIVELTISAPSGVPVHVRMPDHKFTRTLVFPNGGAITLKEIQTHDDA